MSSKKRSLYSTGYVSYLLNSVSIRIGIDKINYKPTKCIRRLELESYWLENTITTISVKTKKNRPALRCGNFTIVLSYNSEFIVEVFTNPSDFTNFDKYFESIYRIIPSIDDDFDISLLDISFDFLNKPHSLIRRHLAFRGTRKLQRFAYDSFEEASIYAGNKLYKFYDKLVSFQKKGVSENYRHKQFDYISRIEKTLKGVNRPTSKLKHLKEALIDPSFNPFKNVELQDFDFPHLKTFNTITNQKTFDLHVMSASACKLVSALGINHALKTLKEDKSYPIDKIIKLKESKSLGDYFHSGINKYFQDGGVYNCKHPEGR